MLYSGIFSSKINNNISLVNPTTIFTQIDNATHATAVPLVMMHYQYNQLNGNALDLGLVQVVDDQIIDVPGAASPYLTEQLFAVAPKSLYFEEPTARFVFKSNLWYTNSGKTIQKREINFNNESGYIQAAWNTQIAYTFSSGGIKTIYFRLTYTDGTSYTSQTNICVTTPTSSLRSETIGREDIPIPATSQHSGGTMQIRLSAYNSTGQIRKPLIVAEGFDVSCIMSSIRNTTVDDFLYKKDTITSVGSINVPYSNWENLRDKIDLAQFDIIYLDYNNGVDDIFRNANLFKAVIDSVNHRKQGNEQNIVMGISMGGLVARIALRQMELAGQNYQTSKYISVDSPHKGANVPVGFQAAVRHLQNIDLKIFFVNVLDYTHISQLKEVVDLLNSMAARQMLIYTINSSYNFNNSVHDAFQTSYDQLGFPKQCENIAISNGSNTGSPNGLVFPAGSAIIDYPYSYSFKWWMDLLSGISLLSLCTNYPQVAWNVIPGSSQLKIEINVDALKNQTASRVYKGKIYIRKKILWLIPVNINLENKTVNSTAGMLPIDGAPGGMYSLSMLGGKLSIPASAVKQYQFCFVPTVSALALSDWSAKLTQNLSTVNTPFNAVFTQGNNELHTRFNSSAQFLYNQLTIPVASTLNITGPSLIYSYGAYGVSNLLASISEDQITWSCSPDLQLRNGNTGLTKAVDVVSYTGTSSWISATTGSIVVTRPVDILQPSNSSYISGPSTLSIGSSTDYWLNNIFFPDIADPYPLQYYYEWTSSPNLSVTYDPPAGVDMPENPEDLDDPDDPDCGEPEEPALPVSMLMSISDNLESPDDSEEPPFVPTVNVHAIACGPGWIKSTFYFPRQTVVVYKEITVINCNTNNGEPIDPGNSDPEEGGGGSEEDGVCGGEDDGEYEEEEWNAGLDDPYYASPYPNPVSNILYVDINETAYTSAKAKRSIASASFSKQNTPAFRILLYDNLGTLVLETSAAGSTQLNVSGVPSGFYYLHVYGETDEKPVRRQVIIRHE